jgi:hypothetical protein
MAGALNLVLLKYRIMLFDRFINCGSSSRHFIAVLAGAAIELVDERRLRTPGLRVCDND